MELPFLVDNVDYLSVERNAGHTVTFRGGRPAHTLLNTVTGSIRYEFSDGRESLEVPEGRCIYLPKGTDSRTVYLCDGTVVEQIRFDVIRGQLPETMTCGPLPEKVTQPVFNRIRREGRTDPLFLLSAVATVIAELRRIPHPYDRLLPALEDMERLDTPGRKNGEYARMCCMSESSFRQMFTKFTGFSPVRYRNRLRLNTAQRMIASGEFSIQEAAREVGFQNLSFFYRAYKQAFGGPPGKV